MEFFRVWNKWSGMVTEISCFPAMVLGFCFAWKYLGSLVLALAALLSFNPHHAHCFNYFTLSSILVQLALLMLIFLVSWLVSYAAMMALGLFVQVADAFRKRMGAFISVSER